MGASQYFLLLLLLRLLLGLLLWLVFSLSIDGRMIRGWGCREEMGRCGGKKRRACHGQHELKSGLGWECDSEVEVVLAMSDEGEGRCCFGDTVQLK